MDNERFSSLRREGWLVSLRIWRDEKAVIRWRTRARHHEVQQKGRTEVFGDYHLRVGEIVADNRLPAGQVLREQRFDETAAPAKLIALSEAGPEGLRDKPDAGAIADRLGLRDTANPGLVDWDVFESISQPEEFILLTSWRDAAAADSSLQSRTDVRHRRVPAVRDYRVFDPSEAPQYYPPAPKVV